jgi:hypothetical protein
MNKSIKATWILIAAALLCAASLVNGQTDTKDETGAVKFNDFRFLSMKGAFDWEKADYPDIVEGEGKFEIEQNKLYQLYNFVDYENPTEKPFTIELKTWHDGKPDKTQVFKDLTKTDRIKLLLGGSADAGGKLALGTYKAELWYNGKAVQTIEMTIIKSRWMPREPGKWSTLNDADFSMGFAKDWTATVTDTEIVASSPDKKVLMVAKLSAAKTGAEAVSEIAGEFANYLTAVKLTDPTSTSTVNGLKVTATGGTARAKGSADAVDASFDIVETGGRVVEIAIYGTSADVNKHAGGILISQESYRPASTKQ